MNKIKRRKQELQAQAFRRQQQRLAQGPASRTHAGDVLWVVIAAAAVAAVAMLVAVAYHIGS